MCGIAGIFAFNDNGRQFLGKIDNAVTCLTARGPDNSGFFRKDNIAFGHTRLAIIDTSDAASQPMTDANNRYTIIFNGEIFNFQELREQLLQAGTQLKSHSDTEVVLQMYIKEGENCVNTFNGFFALAIYDSLNQSLFIARDRMGIKPLLIYQDDDKLIFASEMKAMMEMGIPRELDRVSLFSYLQLNYISPPWTIFQKVNKLQPGSWLKVKNDGTTEHKVYYRITLNNDIQVSYSEASKKLYELLDQSVERRLIADVPLGAFLSGGKDSSIIVALASQHTKSLQTFSIGFKDEPMYDETYYASLVAKKYKTNHTVFSLTDQDLFDNLYSILDYIDEPFADSSAIAVNILSRQTSKYVKVALSGDGADEIFAGYNKHRAEYVASQNSLPARTIKLVKPILKKLPQSRSHSVWNKTRQLYRFADTASLTTKERYWRWASITSEEDVLNLLNIHSSRNEYNKRKDYLLRHIEDNNFNSILKTDMLLVLQGDMLHKVDSMSMANSLEIRVPFLDYHVIDYAFSLPSEYKIYGRRQKKILMDAFGKLLPQELLHRRKQGFEVPLLNWFRSELKSLIIDDLLNDRFIVEQGVFEIEEIRKLKRQLFSKNPGDVQARIWGLIVFQYWWKKYMN